MVYISCFAFSMGPIAWILVSEVFPLRVRGRGVAAASLGSGAANFLVSMTFLSLIKAAGSASTFLIYAGILRAHRALCALHCPGDPGTRTGDHQFRGQCGEATSQ